ncbi:hypothetical protein ACQ4LE_003414 [Meloidogyne hapla]
MFKKSTTKIKLLPNELLFEIFKTINSGKEISTSFLVEERRIKWSKYASKLLTCSSIICAFVGKIFNKKLQKIKNKFPMCYNCETCVTTIWRRDKNKKLVCNACGLYFKLHKKVRPVKLPVYLLHLDAHDTHQKI